MNTLEKYNYKKVFYIGYADNNLVIALKSKYELVISDWFGVTNTSMYYCEEIDDETAYTNFNFSCIKTRRGTNLLNDMVKLK